MHSSATTQGVRNVGQDRSVAAKRLAHTELGACKHPFVKDDDTGRTGNPGTVALSSANCPKLVVLPICLTQAHTQCRRRGEGHWTRALGEQDLVEERHPRASCPPRPSRAGCPLSQTCSGPLPLSLSLSSSSLAERERLQLWCLEAAQLCGRRGDETDGRGTPVVR